MLLVGSLLLALPADALTAGNPVQLTKHPTPVQNWQLTKDSKTVFSLSPETVDKDEQNRMPAKFGVMIRNPIGPRVQLWSLDLASHATRRLSTSRATTSPARC